MAVILQRDTARIEWKTQGALPTCHVGSKYALLVCNKNNANLGEADKDKPGDIARIDAPAVRTEASVFIETTEGEIDLGEREFGLVQAARVVRYRALYAGRQDSEGCLLMDLGLGFTKNPSLDVRIQTGETIASTIFDPSNISRVNVASPKRGVKITLKSGDHPNSALPLTFENLVAHATNRIDRAYRNEDFVVYFVTRERPGAPIEILGALGWAVNWIVEFDWPGAADRPSARVTRANLFPGAFLPGAAAASGPFAQAVLGMETPTTTELHNAVADAIDPQRKDPFLKQLTEGPQTSRDNFLK